MIHNDTNEKSASREESAYAFFMGVGWRPIPPKLFEGY